MSTHAYIIGQVQRALAAYLGGITFSTTVNVYKGTEHATVVEGGGEDDTMQLPAVVCTCVRAAMDPPYGNNWLADVLVSIRTSADDYTETQHHDLADEILRYLHTTTVADDLTAAVSDFTAFLVIPQEQGFAIEERVWVTTYEFQVHCCPGDVS